MTPKELRKLSRLKLVDLLIEQMEENIKLKNELEEARKQLENRQLVCAQTGNLAEASLALSGIFEAAQNAADTYIQSVKAAYPGE